MNRTAFWNEWQSRLSTGCVMGADLYREGKFGDYRCYTVHFDCYDYTKCSAFLLTTLKQLFKTKRDMLFAISTTLNFFNVNDSGRRLARRAFI